jgi:hypothetical protein
MQIIYNFENKTLIIISDMIYDFYHGVEAVAKYRELMNFQNEIKY